MSSLNTFTKRVIRQNLYMYVSEYNHVQYTLISNPKLLQSGLPTSKDQNACDPIRPTIKLKHKIERQGRPFCMCHMPNA